MRRRTILFARGHRATSPLLLQASAYTEQHAAVPGGSGTINNNLNPGMTYKFMPVTDVESNVYDRYSDRSSPLRQSTDSLSMLAAEQAGRKRRRRARNTSDGTTLDTLEARERRLARARRDDFGGATSSDGSSVAELESEGQSNIDGVRRPVRDYGQNIVGRWRSGRVFNEEERRCGMLCFTTTAADGICVLRQAPADRLDAVCKVTWTDTLANEVDEDGNVVLLNNNPRGRWRKVRPPTKVPIEIVSEDNHQAEEQNKKFLDRFSNLGVYERIDGVMPTELSQVEFQLYRENQGAGHILRRAARLLKLPRDRNTAVPGGLRFFGGTHNKFGCVTQRGVFAGTMDALPHASLHYNTYPIVFNPVRYRRSVPEPRGTRYTVLLRCVRPLAASNQNKTHENSSNESPPTGMAAEKLVSSAVEKLTKHLESHGFINYFGLNSFAAAAGIAAHEIGAKVLSGNYTTAMRMWLQVVAQRDEVVFRHYLKYVSAEGSAVRAALVDWINAIKATRHLPHLDRILSKMANFATTARHRDTTATTQKSLPGDVESLSRELWTCVPEAQRIVAAVSAFMFNAAVSARMQKYGFAVVPGDIVKAHVSTMRRITESTSRFKLDKGRTHHQQPTANEGWTNRDAVIGDESYFSELGAANEFVILRVDETNIRFFTIEDVVMPVPGTDWGAIESSSSQHPRSTSSNPDDDAVRYPSHSIGLDFYKSVAASYGVNSAMFGEPSSQTQHDGAGKDSRDPGTGGSAAEESDSLCQTTPTIRTLYRHVISKAQGVESRVMWDPNSYAALFSDMHLIQQRVPQATLLDIDQHVRVPAVTNQPPVVREDIESNILPIVGGHSSRRGDGGDGCSVVLSFALPRGSDPAVALRDGLNLRHYNFQELFYME